MSQLKTKSIKALIWDFIGKIAVQSAGFIISIFLARLLSPEEFGLIGMVMVIVPITQVFMDMGLGAALIQKKEVSQNLFSSVFWLNIIIGAIMTVLLYLSSDYIALFYKRPELSEIIKILSLIFVISSLGIVQNIHFTKSLNFKTHAIISLISNLISGSIAIYLAYSGFGVMALVYQKIIAITISILCYWITSNWRPSFYFSIKDIKSIWGFSGANFIDSVISTIFLKLDIIMIGKMFSATTLGFYTRAQTLDGLINTFTSASLSRVFFPMISNIQDDIEKVKTIYKKSILILSFISIGLSGFLYLVAEDLFIILFTEKWNYSAQLFKLMAIVGFVYPLSSIMINVILGLGHSKKNLKLGLLKKLIALINLYIGFLYGIEIFLYTFIIRNIIGLLLNIAYVKSIIGTKIITQLSWIYKPILITTAIVAGMSQLTNINNIYVSFFVTSTLFSILYIIFNLLLKTEASQIIVNLIKTTLKKRQKS